MRRCPFCSRKPHSLGVHAQSWHCLACKAAGGAIAWVMRTRDLSRTAAADWIIRHRFASVDGTRTIAIADPLCSGPAVPFRNRAKLLAAVRSVTRLVEVLVAELGPPDRWGRYRCPSRSCNGKPGRLYIAPSGDVCQCDTCRARWDVIELVQVVRGVDVTAAATILAPDLDLTAFGVRAASLSSACRETKPVRRKGGKPSKSEAGHRPEASAPAVRIAQPPPADANAPAPWESSTPRFSSTPSGSASRRVSPKRRWGWRKAILAQTIISAGIPDDDAWNEARATVQRCLASVNPEYEWRALVDSDAMLANALAKASRKRA